MEKVSIIIATITRNRPRMLANLYLSLCDMSFPDSLKIEFLVVENNTVNCPHFDRTVGISRKAQAQAWV